MGREVRRVPLDFDCPLNSTWQGFVLPEPLRTPSCLECDGTGLTQARAWLEHIAHLLLMLPRDLVDQDRGQPLHPWLRLIEYRNTRLSPDIKELTEGLAGRPYNEPLGHDSIDRYRTVRKIIEAAGLDPDTWGICPTCKGDGWTEAYPGQATDAEAWEPTDPPTGDGWQLWQTVSEGGPISPVHPTPEALAAWMASPAYTWGASRPMAYDAALAFVLDGWAPSFVVTPTGVVSGEVCIGSQTQSDAS